MLCRHAVVLCAHHSAYLYDLRRQQWYLGIELGGNTKQALEMAQISSKRPRFGSGLLLPLVIICAKSLLVLAASGTNSASV
jgi:hypothetical protein